MNPPTKTDKRIVSRGKYVKAQANRVFHWFAVALFVGFGIRLLGFVWSIWHQVGIGVGLLLLMIIGSLFYTAWDALQRARTIDPGVPLTRANVVDLPAPESLVRASQEPMQSQETMLLRAAARKTQPQNEGQLLRSSVGGQSDTGAGSGQAHCEPGQIRANQDIRF